MRWHVQKQILDYLKEKKVALNITGVATSSGCPTSAAVSLDFFAEQKIN